MEVGRRCPDAVEWTSLIGERRLNAVRTKSVQRLSLRRRNWRVLAIVPMLHCLLDKFAERGTKLVCGYLEIGRSPDLPVRHILRLGGIGVDVDDLDDVEVKMALAECVRRLPVLRSPKLR